VAGRHRQYFEVRDALRQPGCPICRLCLGAVWRYLDSLAYENVNDYTVREELRRAWGFCNRHAWQYLDDVRDLLGTAIIYRDIIRSHDPTAGRPGALAPRADCPVCVARDRAARHAVETLLRYQDDAEMRDALGASDGLCTVHASQALSVGEDAARLVPAITAAWAGGRNAVAHAAGEPGLAGTGVGADWEVWPGAAARELPACEGCPICAAVDVADACQEDAEDALPCNQHLWALARLDADAAAEAARRALARVAPRLAERAGVRRSSLVDAVLETVGIEPREADDRAPFAGLDCPACRRQRGIEASLAPAALGQARPLCLPHLRVALGAGGGAGALAPTRRVWRELEAGLTAYIRSQDYRFRHEPRGAEQQAPRSAVRWIAGEKGVR
jgi:hypothetical protein